MDPLVPRIVAEEPVDADLTRLEESLAATEARVRALVAEIERLEKLEKSLPWRIVSATHGGMRSLFPHGTRRGDTGTRAIRKAMAILPSRKQRRG